MADIKACFFIIMITIAFIIDSCITYNGISFELNGSVIDSTTGEPLHNVDIVILKVTLGKPFNVFTENCENWLEKDSIRDKYLNKETNNIDTIYKVKSAETGCFIIKDSPKIDLLSGSEDNVSFYLYKIIFIKNGYNNNEFWINPKCKIKAKNTISRVNMTKF